MLVVFTVSRCNNHCDKSIARLESGHLHTFNINFVEFRNKINIIFLFKPTGLVQRSDFGFVRLPSLSIDDGGNQTKPKSFLLQRIRGSTRRREGFMTKLYKKKDIDMIHKSYRL